MIKLLLRAPVSRDEVDGFARSEGFSRSFDSPWTSGVRTTNWRRGDDIVALIAEAAAGAALIAARGPGSEEVSRRFGERFGGQPLSEVLAEARAAADPAARARTLLRLALMLDGAPPDAESAALIGERLRDTSKPARWAAYEAALVCLWPSLDEAVADAARRYEDMQPALERWTAARRRREEEQAKAEASRQRDARRAGLAGLLAEGRWERLLEEATAVLADGAQADGFYHRALALEGLARPAAAYVNMLAASATSKEQDRERVHEALPRLAAALAGRGGDAEEVVAAVLEVRDRIRGDRRDEILIEALRGLLAAPAGAEAELTLALGALLEREIQLEAVQVLERAAELVPELPEVWYTLASARSRTDDQAGTDAAYEEALRRLRDAQPRSPAADRAARLFERLSRPISARMVTATLLKHHLEARRYQRVLEVAVAAIAHDPDDVQAFERRAVALTFLDRHEEAIAAYGEALTARDRVYPEDEPSAGDPRGLMRFNRACELARLGRKEEALADLRAAMRHDTDWGQKARDDNYFEALWHDRDFLRVALGREGEAPTREEVERLTSRCMGLFYRGEGDEALEAGEQAAGMAEILGDPALLSDALKSHGNALTYLKGPAQGAATLRRAVELAEQAFPDDPSRRAEARHLLGAAHHAGKEYDEAERCYRAALAERVAGLGEGHWLLAKSYGDIARLEADQGRLADAIATIERGRGVLRSFLAAGPGEDERIEALFDLATLSSNLSRVLLDDGARVAPALDALDEAAQRLGEIAAAGRRPASSLTRNALRHAAAAAQLAGGDDALRARAEGLSQRLFEILEPLPAVRAERLYWATLRAGARELAARGVSETEIAAAMREALRGNDIPEPVRSHPAFANLPLELATRLGRRGDLVLVMMALSTAMAGGSLDEALENLEGIAVAEVEIEAAGGDVEGEDEEDEEDGEDDGD